MEYHTYGGMIIAELICPAHCIRDTQDILDLMATVSYCRDAAGIMIKGPHLPEDFFDLHTGLAGELL
ncbi:MAG TPA: DUF4180 domain-containing protein [Bacteroidetes bacterium]|nr:DUF4180 domain-containing protein [Bacteroidota bacterium]